MTRVSVLTLFIIALIIGVLSIFFSHFLNLEKTLQKSSNKQNNTPSAAKSSVTGVSSNNGKMLGEKMPFNLDVSDGYHIGLFAKDLGGARDLLFSPSGKILLVSSTNEGNVWALADSNGDGISDIKKEILTGLDNPHGLAFYKGKLYVDEERKIDRYNFDEKNLTASFDKKIVDLPSGGRHFTRSVVFDKDGKMYISIGSTCDVCHEDDSRHGTVMVTDSEGRNPQVYASGLRNSVFLALRPGTDQLWVTEMGRDYIGDNLPPDEINMIKKEGDYGWPNCYGNRVPDKTFDPNLKQDDCQNTIPPVYEIQAHSAPLGLAFWKEDLVVSYHGSWNRSIPTGYKVVLMKVEGDKINGVRDLVSGFLVNREVKGRPVDVTFGSEGNLFISDDKNGMVYIVTKIN